MSLFEIATLEINICFRCCQFFWQDVDHRYLWCRHAHYRF